MKKVFFGTLMAATALFSACGGNNQSTPTGDLSDELVSLLDALGL